MFKKERKRIDDLLVRIKALEDSNELLQKENKQLKEQLSKKGKNKKCKLEWNSFKKC